MECVGALLFDVQAFGRAASKMGFVVVDMDGSCEAIRCTTPNAGWT